MSQRLRLGSRWMIGVGVDRSVGEPTVHGGSRVCVMDQLRHSVLEDG